MAKRQASLLEISRGAVYYQQRPTSEADLALMRRIDELHLEHPFMGARMMRRQLQRQSIHVGRRHLSTLMELMGIQALCPQPGTSKRHPQHKIYPYLLARWRYAGPTRSGRWTRPTFRCRGRPSFAKCSIDYTILQSWTRCPLYLIQATRGVAES
jgi:HTH-like domain